MNKSFLTLTIITLISIAVPIFGMEDRVIETISAVKPNEFIFKLELIKTPQHLLNQSYANKFYDKGNEHSWDTLGIEAKKSTNIYLIDRASFITENYDIRCWTKGNPNKFPLSQLPNPYYKKEYKYNANTKSWELEDNYTLNCPTSLPEYFVEDLKLNDITIENGKFQTPTKIIFKLRCINDYQKKNIPNINLITDDNSNNNSAKSSKTKYIFLGGIAAIILIFLQQNNKLNLSFITKIFDKFSEEAQKRGIVA